MLPIPTRTGLATLAGAVIAVLLGAGLGSWPAVVLGGTVVGGLALGLAMTMPLGRRVRRHRLEFAWWLGHAEPGSGGGAVVPGKPFEPLRQASILGECPLDSPQQLLAFGSTRAIHPGPL